MFNLGNAYSQSYTYSCHFKGTELHSVSARTLWQFYCFQMSMLSICVDNWYYCLRLKSLLEIFWRQQECVSLLRSESLFMRLMKTTVYAKQFKLVVQVECCMYELALHIWKSTCPLIHLKYTIICQWLDNYLGILFIITLHYYSGCDECY